MNDNENRVHYSKLYVWKREIFFITKFTFIQMADIDGIYALDSGS